MIEIHPQAKISKFADIEDSIRGTRIVIGAYSSIDSFVKLKPAGGTGNVVIGERTVINSGCVLYTGNGISIGTTLLSQQTVLLRQSIMRIKINLAKLTSKDFYLAAVAS